jgi:hypothetical protein
VGRGGHGGQARPLKGRLGRPGAHGVPDHRGGLRGGRALAQGRGAGDGRRVGRQPHGHRPRHDSANSNKRGKPAGAKAAYVYSFVGAEYPADAAAWTFEGATTRPRFQVGFPSTVAGGTQVWLCAAWVNAKQEAGPTSVPITTNLQGGGGVGGAGLMKIAA